MHRTFLDDGWKGAGTCNWERRHRIARFQNLSDTFALKMSSSDSVPEDQLPAVAQGTEQPEVTLATFTEEQLQVLYPVWSCLPFQALQLNLCDFFHCILQSMRDCANAYKDNGNSLFSQHLFDEAIAQYSLALDAAPPQDPCRAVFFNNRAACFYSKASLTAVLMNSCNSSLLAL
jgi:tetratricopeptide (TPR) repeat protein